MYLVTCMGKERKAVFECFTKKEVDGLMPFVYERYPDCKVTIEGDSEHVYVLVHEKDGTEVLYLDDEVIYVNESNDSIVDLLKSLKINFEEE